MKLGEIDPEEIQEVFRINAIAPLMIFQTFTDLLLKSTYERRMVINVHAREGLFNIKGKSSNHPHTNMAKAALHQLTLSINTTIFDGGQKFNVLVLILVGLVLMNIAKNHYHLDLHH